MSNQTCPICGLDQYPHDTAKTMCFASVDTYGTEGGLRDCYKRGYMRLEAVLRDLIADDPLHCGCPEPHPTGLCVPCRIRAALSGEKEKP